MTKFTKKGRYIFLASNIIGELSIIIVFKFYFKSPLFVLLYLFIALTIGSIIFYLIWKRKENER